MHLLLDWLAILVLALGALADWRSRRIPNALVLSLMLLAWIDRVLADGLLTGTITALMAGLIGALPWLMLWGAGWIGAGDAKYFAAGAMLLPIPVIWQAVALAALLGGAFSGLWLAARRLPPAAAIPSDATPAIPAASSVSTVPYAIPMGLALVAIRWWAHGQP